LNVLPAVLADLSYTLMEKDREYKQKEYALKKYIESHPPKGFLIISPIKTIESV